ncbi:MAG TPA: hypothetical protein VGR87_09495 [Candidatus Limnocylindria bacterium]|jgi:hypothetical protein|nr:hypothetical protein [Candidatus Limnocylindria bacterium]
MSSSSASTSVAAWLRGSGIGFIMTDGDILGIVRRPGTSLILGVAVVFFALPFLVRLYGRARAHASGGAGRG